MTILCTPLYEAQLKALLQTFAKEDLTATKKFKMYLDTILINIPTKVKKYKQSIYSEDTNVKDIEHENCTISFYIDKETDNYIILSIIQK